MVSSISKPGRSDTSFNIQIPVSEGLKIRNVTIETTNQIGEVTVKLDHYNDTGGLVGHLGKGEMSNLGSWSVPFAFNGEYDVLESGFIKGSVLNETGISIYTVLTVNPARERR